MNSESEVRCWRVVAVPRTFSSWGWREFVKWEDIDRAQFAPDEYFHVKVLSRSIVRNTHFLLGEGLARFVVDPNFTQGGQN